MGFLTRALSPAMLRPPETDDFWYGPVGQQSLAGVKVDSQTAMNYSAVWAATRLIADTIATLPRYLFRRTSEGGKRPATAHSSYSVFKTEPNPEMGALNYMAYQLGFLVNWGNCFAELVRDGMGRVVREYPIHPSRVTCDYNENGELVYLIRNNDGTQQPFPKLDADGNHRLLHISSGIGNNSICGMGVLDVAIQSIGMGLATERFGAAFFGNGANPSVVLKSKKRLGQDGAENLRQSWRARYSGPDKSGSVLVLEEDTDVTRLDVPNNASQFLETRQFNITEIARWYNLPVHMLREMSKSSFNNIEQENLHFVMISLMPWAKRYEEERDRQILPVNEKRAGTYFHKVMFQGLLRGDVAARTAHYKEMFGMGVYTINDILRLEDRNPIDPDIGDVRLVAANNMQPLEKVIAGPPEPPPVPPSPPQEDTDDDEEESQQQSFDGMINELRETLEARHAAEIADQDAAAEQRIAAIQGDFDAAQANWSEREAAMLSATREMLTSTLERLTNREVIAVRRMAKHPGEFLAKIEDFYEKQTEILRENLEPVCGACSAFGLTVSAESLTESVVTMAREQLLDVAGSVTADELENAVTTLTTDWETAKAAGIVEQIFDRTSVGAI